MSTANGQIAVNFAAIANTNPWTNANFSALGTGVLQVLSGAALSTGAGHRTPHYIYTGSMAANATIKVKFEVDNNPGGGDVIRAPVSLVNGAGYMFALNGTNLAVQRSANLANSSITPNALSSNTNTGAAGDNFELWVIPNTPSANILTFQVYKNGVIIPSLNVTDNTYVSGLYPVIGLDEQNSN